MSATKANSKRVSDSEIVKDRQKRTIVEDDFDDAISDDIKGIMSALRQIKEKAQKDDQKKKEETISSVSSEIKSSLDELKSKIEKERQSFAKALLKSSKEVLNLCENLLKSETAKYQEIHEKLCKEKSAHLQALKDVFSKYEEEKEKLFLRYEQLRKKEKNMISELEKSNSARIAQLEESLKTKKQDDKALGILKKSLGSFLGNASDEDFPPYD